MNEMSRLEINVKRLLTRCEMMAKDDLHKDWKLEKYILSLDDMMDKLQTLPNKPSKDTITSYTKRIDFLKGVINTIKLPNPVERVVATQLLPKTSMSANDSVNTNITTQIHQKTIAKYNREMRTELFHVEKNVNEDGVRQRLSTTSIQSENLDTILKYNRNVQEKIAENMITMTHNIKEHALVANAIIKKDIGTLEKSDQLTDVNTAKLKKESLRLEEHTNSKWRCWVWFIVAFVMVVFLNMLFFIRVAKKKV